MKNFQYIGYPATGRRPGVQVIGAPRNSIAGALAASSWDAHESPSRFHQLDESAGKRIQPQIH